MNVSNGSGADNDTENRSTLPRLPDGNAVDSQDLDQRDEVEPADGVPMPSVSWATVRNEERTAPVGTTWLIARGRGEYTQVTMLQGGLYPVVVTGRRFGTEDECKEFTARNPPEEGTLLLIGSEGSSESRYFWGKQENGTMGMVREGEYVKTFGSVQQNIHQAAPVADGPA